MSNPRGTSSHAPRPRLAFRDTIQNESWLRSRYLDEGMNAGEIARLAGCSRTSVHAALEKFGIPKKTLSEAKAGRPTNAWNDERRAAFSELRRGSGNPMYLRAGRRGEEWTGDPAEDARRGMRRYKHGLSQAEYDALLESQGGVCAICKKPESVIRRKGKVQAMPVDHDHKTMRIRGLLCHRCNVALGYFGDDPDLLRAAADYLTRE